MKCNIVMKRGVLLKTISGLVEVDGTEVKDFPFFRTFVHRAVSTDAWTGEWAVSEFFTGARISFGDTKKDAITRAREVIGDKTKKKVMESIKMVSGFPMANYHTKWR